MKYYPYTRIFPISHSHVGQFIAFSIQQGLKGSTIQTQVAGLSYINKMMGFGNLTDHFVIKKLLLSATKTTFSQDKRLPITIPILRQLLDILKVTVSQPFSQTLYKAMFTTAFFALLRVGEMTYTSSGSNNILQLQDITYSRSNKGVLCASVYMCFVVTCWERADLLALVCGVFCEFVTFPFVSWVRCGT